ncbi:choice-of-anchor G family protein [Nocardioides jiangxiensis]|uniref:Choice-of-anchor G family protein n=1 Tax=Nocardioides jiangxiensis TaxID=3064524 RepID=A0ABT9AYM5_9ACTN|nr:choice-of-anchor G family protein [Nocardioides sp. WY-20]MDO7867686.1 choice-of-anchor G family protein [Nocardioides sp. WY-20]
MFRRAEWGSSQGSNLGRRTLAVCAVTITTFACSALPAGAASADTEGDTAHASASVLGDGSTAAGYSEATWDTDPGPNSSGPVTTLPFSDVIAFGQAGAMKSVSTTTSPVDGTAISGLVGSDGQVTLDSAEGGFAPATVDLLAAMRKGGADLSDSLVDQALLRLGIGGSQVVAHDGVILDQDGVGGPGRYRVGQADLELHSPKIDEAAAMIYDAVGRADRLTEDTVNKMLSLTTLTSKLPAGASLTARVHSDMQDQIFRDILAKPVTTKNKVLTVDFSTGRATLHLDQLMHGEEWVDGPLLPGQYVREGDLTGINRQQPNTEIIDDEIYPMIAETIHDLIDEVTTIAVGAIDGALASVTVDFTATLKSALGTGTATWSTNLMTPQVKPATCVATGVGGPVMCTLLTTAINTVVAPLANQLLVPVRDFLLGDDGANLYGLAIADLKTGMITIPVRDAIDPFLQALSQVVSLQVNSQRPSYCTASDGTRRLSGLKLSAFSIALARSSSGPRVGLGNSGVTTRCDGVLSH